MIDNNMEIKYSLNTSVGDNIKIMNIHKSKGLEFPLCYFTGYYKSFNISDLKELFMYNTKYGIITPVNTDGIKSTIIKTLAKELYMHEEISEKIRLFYVGLTRAREKMIIVLPLSNDDIKLDDTVRLKYRSFLDIINSIKNSLSDKIKNINIDNDIIDEKRFSKNSKELINVDNLDNMKLGTKIHYILETTDFINPNYNIIEDKYRNYIKAFLDNKLLKDMIKLIFIKNMNLFIIRIMKYYMVL